MNKSPAGQPPPPSGAGVSWACSTATSLALLSRRNASLRWGVCLAVQIRFLLHHPLKMYSMAGHLSAGGSQSPPPHSQRLWGCSNSSGSGRFSRVFASPCALLGRGNTRKLPLVSSTERLHGTPSPSFPAPWMTSLINNWINCKGNSQPDSGLWAGIFRVH